MHTANNNRKFNLTFFGILLAFMIGLSFLFPYSGDDWAWGTQEGAQLLEKWFAGYNGRYLGNLMEMAATRVHWLRALMQGALMTAIPALITALSDHKKKTVAVSSTILMLLCSRDIACQAVVWAAGFFNYVPPLVAVLFFAWCCKQTYDGKWKSVHIPAALGMLVLGVLSAFFMETMTLFNIVFAVAVIGFVWFTRKQVWPISVGWLAGSLMGALIMFSNSVYGQVMRGEGVYDRELAGGLLEGVIKSAPTVFEYGMYQNIFLNIVVTVLMVWFVSRRLGEQSRGKRALCTLLTVYVACWGVYAVLSRLNSSWKVLGNHTDLFKCVSGVGYLVACFLLLLLLSDDKRLTLRVWALYGSLGVMIVPLFVVNPIGPRNFFDGYVVQIMIACMLISYLGKDRALPRITAISLLSVLTVICLYWTSIYGYIYKVDLQRDAYIDHQLAQGKETIEVVIWPYEEYVWWPREPEEREFYPRKKLAFRRFEGMPDDVKIQFITLTQYYGRVAEGLAP